jgi:methylated-DNA-protein-cysteine methyltransferase related protein
MTTASSIASFYEQVRALTQQVPPGRVTTYGALSALIVGHSRAARTVGWALHALTPVEAETVPWWRVINSQGRVSTSCVTHTAAEQRARLEDEGVVFGPDDRVDLARFGWFGPD